MSWLRTDPSDAVYVRGDDRRASRTMGGSTGYVGDGRQSWQVQSVEQHASWAVCVHVRFEQGRVAPWLPHMWQWCVFDVVVSSV